MPDKSLDAGLNIGEHVGKLHDDGRESPEAHAYSRGFTAGNDLVVTEGAKVERERIVAWMRDPELWKSPVAVTEELAAALERGDHHA